MSFNIGLKLWSTNTDFYFEEAKRLYQDKVFDYIELYVVPDTLQNIDKWKTLNIPLTLHAPHFMHGINLAKKEYEVYNKEIFAEVAQFYKVLNPEYIVVHSGTDGNIEETARQMTILKNTILSHCTIIIENKPFRAIPNNLDAKLCMGATVEEIKYIINTLQCGFCLDVGHAICSANSQNKEPYAYLEQFNALSPHCYHLSDNIIENSIDQHLHFGEGTFDFDRIFSIIDSTKDIAIETKKDSKENLDDFIEDVQWIKKVKIQKDYYKAI